MPTISVIMSVYKEPLEWIKESIDSILNQTFKDFEFIIVNDNPEDDKLLAFLKEYEEKDARVRVLVNEFNIGLTKSLNYALREAKGRYIARMDADDISNPERFREQIDFLLNNEEIAVCGTAIEYMGNLSGVHYFPKNQDEIFLFLETCFAHPTVMFRAEILKSNEYSEQYKVSQDFELWVRLYAQGYLFANLQSILLKYRVSNIQISKKKSHLQSEVSKKLRRKALIMYCQKNNINIDYLMANIDYQTFSLILNNVSLPTDTMQLLLYYIILSVSDIKDFFKCIISCIIKRSINIHFLLLAVYHRLCGDNMQKF